MRGLAILIATSSCGRLNFEGSLDGQTTAEGLLPPVPACTIAPSVPVSAMAGVDTAAPTLAWAQDSVAIAWHDTRASDAEIFYARLDLNGAKLTADLNVSNTAQNSWYPSIAYTNSEFGITWSEEVASQDALFRRVANDALVGGNVVVTSTTGDAWLPIIVWALDRFVVAFADDTVANYEMHLATLAPNGTTLLPTTKITTTQGTFGRTAAFMGSMIALAYKEAETAITVSRFALDGSAAGSAMIVTDTVGVERPSIAWSGAGFGLAWEDPSSGTRQIYFTRLQATLERVGGDLVLAGGGDSYTPLVVWSGSAYYVLWQQDRGNGPELFVALIGAEGELRYGPTAIGPQWMDDYPAAVWANDRLAIAWITGPPTDSDLMFTTATCP